MRLYKVAGCGGSAGILELQVGIGGLHRFSQLFFLVVYYERTNEV